MISADESRKECKHMEKNLLTQGARGKNLERLSEEKGASLPCFSPEKGKHPGPYAHTPCSDPRLSDLYGPESVSQHITRPSGESSWEKSQPEEGHGFGAPRGSCKLGAFPEVRSQPPKRIPALVKG